jgi:hypothetical protein
MIGRKLPATLSRPAHSDKRYPASKSQLEEKPEKSYAMDGLKMPLQKYIPQKTVGGPAPPIVLNEG